MLPSFPALVLTSLLFSTHLTFALAPVYIGALLLTALAVREITGDGEAQTFEGLALIAIYVVLAAFALYDERSESGAGFNSERPALAGRSLASRRSS